jgi:hypothetical protein
LVVEENDKYLEIGEVCEFGEACVFWRNLEKHVFLEKYAKGTLHVSPLNMLWKTKTNYETFEIIV